ncbi:MAG: hypothetical protein M3Y87_22025 [Myxococcota bacterium]|nr:hypothetical protein [Myxococcota bacterium]
MAYLVLLSAGCSGPAYSCASDYFCVDYVAGFTEEEARAACDADVGMPKTFSVDHGCSDEPLGVPRLAHCDISSTDGRVMRLHLYGFDGGPTVAELEATRCPGPSPAPSWSYELHPN